MHVFLPFKGFQHSAKSLDSKRLDKQREEGLFILQTLLGENDGEEKNTNGVLMWRNYEFSLCLYIIEMCTEHMRRGGRDHIAKKVRDLIRKYGLKMTGHPPWIGDEEVHASHRSGLLRKSPVCYAKAFRGTSSDIPLKWPVTKKDFPEEQPDEQEDFGPEEPVDVTEFVTYSSETELGDPVVLRRPKAPGKPAPSCVRVLWSGFRTTLKSSTT